MVSNVASLLIILFSMESFKWIVKIYEKISHKTEEELKVSQHFQSIIQMQYILQVLENFMVRFEHPLDGLSKMFQPFHEMLGTLSTSATKILERATYKVKLDYSSW